MSAIEPPVMSVADAKRRAEENLRRAAPHLISRGLEMLEAGRLEPTDVVEQWLLTLARDQVAVNVATGLPPYMRGGSTATARIVEAAQRDATRVQIRSVRKGGWVAVVGSGTTLTARRFRAVELVLREALPNASESVLAELTGRFSDETAGDVDTTVGAIRAWARAAEAA